MAFGKDDGNETAAVQEVGGKRRRDPHGRSAWDGPSHGSHRLFLHRPLLPPRPLPFRHSIPYPFPSPSPVKADEKGHPAPPLDRYWWNGLEDDPHHHHHHHLHASSSSSAFAPPLRFHPPPRPRLPLDVLPTPRGGAAVFPPSSRDPCSAIGPGARPATLETLGSSFDSLGEGEGFSSNPHTIAPARYRTRPRRDENTSWGQKDRHSTYPLTHQ